MDKEISFEAAMKRLEEIANIIQKNDCSLDEGINLYEEGLKLARYCSEKLNGFQERLQQINNGEQ